MKIYFKEYSLICHKFSKLNINHEGRMTNSIEKRGPANLSGSVFAIYRRDGKG